MNDRDANNDPLFKNMDQQERIYAPEEVPGMQIPSEERDRGSDVGENPARADRDAEPDIPIFGVIPGAGGVTGSSGGSAGTGGAGVLPVVPMSDELDPDADREVRHDEDRERL